MTRDGTLWVKVSTRSSWHILSTYSRTRCGRMAIASLAVNDLPMGACSCESCLRLAMHDRERVA